MPKPCCHLPQCPFRLERTYEGPMRVRETQPAAAAAAAAQARARRERRPSLRRRAQVPPQGRSVNVPYVEPGYNCKVPEGAEMVGEPVDPHPVYIPPVGPGGRQW